jgi:hypothetical protein
LDLESAGTQAPGEIGTGEAELDPSLSLRRGNADLAVLIKSIAYQSVGDVDGLLTRWIGDKSLSLACAMPGGSQARAARWHRRLPDQW